MRSLRRVAPIAAILMAVVVVSAILLSNVVEFRGPLHQGVITLSEIGSNGMPGILSLDNGTAKTFEWNATNRANRTVDFDLHVVFFLHGIMNGGFTVLDFNWSLNGVFLNDTPPFANLTTSWEDYYPDSLEPFAKHPYELTLTFTFVGAGDYTLRITAVDYES